MSVLRVGTAKIDPGFAELIDDGFDPSAAFPVVIACSDPARLGDLETEVERCHGRVRHRHAILRAISAWLPLSAATALAGLDYVDAIELDQPSEIA